MNSKQKAKELVERFNLDKTYAKFCVEEMKKASTRITQHLPDHWVGTEQEYYEEVKQEIEKL